MRLVRLSEHQLRGLVRKMVREGMDPEIGEMDSGMEGGYGEGMGSPAERYPQLPAGQWYVWRIGPATGMASVSEIAEGYGMSPDEYFDAQVAPAAMKTGCAAMWNKTTDNMVLYCQSGDACESFGYETTADAAQSWSAEDWFDALGEPRVTFANPRTEKVTGGPRRLR